MVKEHEFIPLTNDILFKEVLTKEDTRDFLILFLETFTKLPKEIITDNLKVEYQKPINKTNYYDKGIIGDVIVTFANYIVNIEMFTNFNKNSINKSTLYGMRIFATQLKRGEDYNKLKNFIQLNLVANVHLPFVLNNKSDYRIVDVANNYEEMLPVKYEMKYYRIDKALEDNYNEDMEIKLLKFIGAQSEEERVRIAKGDKILMDTIERIRKNMESDGFLETMAMWKRQDELESIKEAKEEAYNKTLDIAKKLKNKNYDVKEIKEITALSIEEIEKL